ncbi:MAG: molybdenum cofactor biosynthesis protein MoaB [Candidatus Lokiarchaeota archaeon]|nr:molybdenum cofactor biosynthesis protein MoaB [Candidatus Lokiarchaeota archaeon]
MVKSKAKREHLIDCPKQVNIGLIIVSTSRTREIRNNLPCTDQNIPLMKEILSRPIELDVDTTYNISFATIIPDDADEILTIMRKHTHLDSKTHVLIFSGGTGITKKDITIETLTPFFNKEIPGFGELFRFLSYQDVGNSTILSRATAGIISNVVVFLIPGSKNAVKIALEQIIAPELPHVLSEIYREIRRETRD